ncbi:MAG TPA: hypothetical protein VGM23_04525, partial [Armatimonadota bacterium]
MTGKTPHNLHTQQQRLGAILERYRDKEERPKAERRHLIRLWREYVYPSRWRLLVAIFFTVLFSLEQYFWAFVAKIWVDDVLWVGRGPVPPALLPLHERWVIYILVSTTIVRFILILCIWQSNFHVTLVGQRVVYELRKALHEKLQSLPLSFFDRIQ